MKILVGIIVVVGLIMNATLLLLTVRPSPNYQLIFYILLCSLLLLVVVSAVAIAFKWKKLGKRSLIPLGAAILAIVLGFPLTYLGHFMRSQIFLDNLPRYEEAIRLIDNRLVKKGDGFKTIKLPSDYNDMSIDTSAEKEESGVLTVEFIIGRGFPLKHYGYLYRSNGLLQNWHKRRWPQRSKIRENWYRIGD